MGGLGKLNEVQPIEILVVKMDGGVRMCHRLKKFGKLQHCILPHHELDAGPIGD